jgi:hypothetical protein
MTAEVALALNGGACPWRKPREHGCNDQQCRNIAQKMAPMLWVSERLRCHDSAVHDAGPDGEAYEASVGERVARGEDQEHAKGHIDPQDHLQVHGLPRMPGPARRPEDRERIYPKYEYEPHQYQGDPQIFDAINFGHDVPPLIAVMQPRC